MTRQLGKIATWRDAKQGCHVSDPDLQPIFESVLQEWLKMLGKYGEFVTKDQAFWWTEITNCSLLSTAAWQAGYISLSEFQHRKDQLNPDMERDGRGDLYISSKERDFYLEAKQMRLQLSDPPERLESQLRSLLRDAVKAANSSRPRDEPGDPIGIGFVIFTMHRDCLSNADQYLIDLMRTVEGMSELDAYAWYLPEKLLTDTWLYGDWFFPGIFLLMQRPEADT
jgi:hypothetical protein